jgi:hypothetical protein
LVIIIREEKPLALKGVRRSPGPEGSREKNLWRLSFLMQSAAIKNKKGRAMNYDG